MRGVILFIGVLCSLALGYSSTQQDYFKKLEQLVINEDASILRYKKEKIFLNADRLMFSPSGIFVLSDANEFLPIQSISYSLDDVGYYVLRVSGYYCCDCRQKYPYIHPPECVICKGTRFSPYWDCNH